MVVLAAVAVTAVACKEQVKQEPPLLLENGNSGPVADNSRCRVCHMNFEDEALAFVHARANIGCEQCHGASNAHYSDEDNITTPDIMYPPAKINPFCLGCHPRNKLRPLHKSFFTGTAAKENYCIDCHGDHRLGFSARKPDKPTGNLTEDDKVRMPAE